MWSAGSQPKSEFALVELPLFYAFVFLAIFSWPYFRVRSMFHEFPALLRSRRVSFRVDGIHIESEDAQGDYKWSLFYQIVETPKTFLIMQTNRAATYVPKRCLSKSDDVVILRRLIRDNFKGKLRLRND
jgi:YcxB-like protein